jgi:cell division protease FtsH
MSENLDDTPPYQLTTPFASERTKRRGITRADYALADAVVAELITPDLAHKLKNSVTLNVVIEVPDDDWAIPIHGAIKRRFLKLHGKCYLDTGNKRLPAEVSLIDYLYRGEPILAVSADIDHRVPAPILQTADIILRVGELSRDVVADAIFGVTGSRIRKLDAIDFEGLGFEAMAACFRAGSAPADCRRRMIQARSRLQGECANMPEAGPTIAELPLLPAVKDWADQTLAAMAAMEAKTLTVADAPFSLLGGPPGSGKTLLASAIARSAGWDFVSTSMSAWFAKKEGHLGDVTKATAQFFDTLMASKRPIVALIDELDALPDRASLSSRNAEWWTPIITGTLLQIDRLRKAETPVLLFAATNYPDRIDEAVKRPGRLGVHLTVSNPQTEAEVVDVFRFYLKDTVTEDQLHTLARFAFASPELTPAKIGGWVIFARARALQAQQELAFDHVMTAIVGVDDRTQAQLYRAAIHEAGHAVIAQLHDIPVHSISIVRGAGVEGLVTADFGTGIMDRQRIEGIVRTLLAGRAADLAILDITDTGSAEDLAMATSILTDVMTKRGLYDQLAVFRSRSSSLDGATRRRIDDKLQDLFAETQALVEAHRADIEGLADRLVTCRVISGVELDREQNTAPLPPEMAQA